jgi:hypothetical protein
MLEMTLVNPNPAEPGSGSSADISLIPTYVMCSRPLQSSSDPLQASVQRPGRNLVRLFIIVGHLSLPSLTRTLRYINGCESVKTECTSAHPVIVRMLRRSHHIFRSHCRLQDCGQFIARRSQRWYAMLTSACVQFFHPDDTWVQVAYVHFMPQRVPNLGLLDALDVKRTM